MERLLQKGLKMGETVQTMERLQHFDRLKYNQTPSNCGRRARDWSISFKNSLKWWRRARDWSVSCT